MQQFTYHNFDVTITAHDEGYLYVADNGSHQIADPHPHHKDGLYTTHKDAEESAKQAIFLYEITSMFINLPSLEQDFVRYVTQRISKGDWIVSSESGILDKVMKAGCIRTRR
jgi:hypothetical protein